MEDPRFTQIRHLIETFGSSRYGEDVTQIEHVLQCGHLAMEAGETDTMIVAALLHDIGQFIDDTGNAAETLGIDARHEELGATWLARWFGPAVTEPVRLHVDAKRYLCATEPGYPQSLSRASQISLALQGGPMNASECEAFAAGRWFAEAIRLRRYDDEAKRPDWPCPGLADHRDRIVGAMKSEN
ncbi:HD domain protein [Novosphingobium nitrogenifigens DSM 19370]|uniref:HD domain protein n=1 Tax=Novosphingobium nitrogenifigens DSM 19370 TaxID=983920 RepID=F1Z3I2_9SPHN|nr:HD domain-containing protein [Novosphingobium nitrogenifigens]EGD60796.1 HD domain protein [Novosphingobium nitrogenifigens DSM 19370]